MKPSRFSLFASLCRIGLTAAVATLPAYSVEVFFNNTSTDWTVLTGWNLAVDGSGGNPTLVPGDSGATDYDVTFGVTSLSGLSSGRTVQTKGDRTIGLLKTVNINNVITLTTGAASNDTNMFRTLQLTGIEHTRGGLTLGSTTDRQRVNLSLVGTPVTVGETTTYYHTWNSATAGSSGTYTGSAIFVLNDVSPAGGTPVTLILTGRNTGSKVDGAISGPISLIKSSNTGTGLTPDNYIWTLNGDNSFTGTVTVEEGILKLGHGNAIPDPSKLTVAAGKTVSLLLVPSFTSERINAFTSQASYGSASSILELDTAGADASYDASIPVGKVFTLRKIGSGSLTLNGNSAFGGTIAVNAGILRLKGNNTFSTNVTFGSGASLILDGNNTISGNLNVGDKSLVLLGTTTFTGTTGKVTLNGGNLTIQGPSTIVPGTGKPITSSGSSSILVGIGEGGFSEEQFYNIQSTLSPWVTVTGTPSYGISTATGDRLWDGALLGASPFAKGGPGTLTLWGNRTDTGAISVREGSLRVFNLANGGSPSPIGASPAAAANLTLGGGRLIYAGTSDVTTDRLFTMTANSSLEASGVGTVQFTNTGSMGLSGTRNLLLLGTNRGQNILAASIGGATSITKQGTGTWWLSGANTATGNVRVDSGELVFDYATADPLGGNLQLNGGIAHLKGNGTSSTETIPTVTFALSQTSGTHLKVSDGMQLSIGTLNGGGLAQRNDLIDLSGHPSNSITVGTLAPNFAVVNGVLMSNGSTNAGRASIALRAQDGSYGFPTLSGGTSGTLQKLTALTEIAPGSSIAVNDNTANYLFKTAGNYSSSNNLVFGTMTFDSNDGDINLDMGIKLITPTGYGKAFLFHGNNNVTVNAAVGNTDAGDSSALWFHNYLHPDKKFLLSASLGDASQYAIFGGPGLTEYYGDNFVGNMLIHNGILRITKEQQLVQPVSNISGSKAGANFKVSNGGVLEIGAQITMDAEYTPLDFSKPVGAMTGGIRFLGDSGISAYRTGGGVRLIQFSNLIFDWFSESPNYVTYVAQDLSWGRGYFLTTPETENAEGEYAFKLSSAQSNATVEVRNAIDLNGKQRTVDVANGSADIDAHLAGNLTGDAFSGLLKTGAGTLKLSGINSYKGETRITEGKVIADSASFDPASTIRLEEGGILELPVTDVEVAAVYVNGTRRYGSDITAPNIIGPAKLKTSGTLTGYAQWVVDKNLDTLAEPGEDYDKDGLANLVEYATGTEPKQPDGSALTITGTTTRQIQFNQAAGRTDLNAVLQASPNLAAPWTDIATSNAGGEFTGISGVSVSTSGTTVTVTDSRNPAAPVMFYRVQYELAD